MSQGESSFPQVLSETQLKLRGSTADHSLLEAINRQLKKDLSTDLLVAPSDPQDAIAEWSELVEGILNDPATDLQATLYRVDVPEHWAKQQRSMQQLAQAIVVRCAQKVIMRLNWSNTT